MYLDADRFLQLKEQSSTSLNGKGKTRNGTMAKRGKEGKTRKRG